LCYGTLGDIGKIGVKNAKRFDKKWRFLLIFSLFFRTIDGLLRYGTVRYGTLGYGALENSDKNGLPIVLFYCGLGRF
jgi:hypothetical protein